MEDREKKHSPLLGANAGSSTEENIIEKIEASSDTRIEMTTPFEYSSSLPFKQVIDVITFSPNGEQIATYAAKEGKLVTWNITNRGVLVEDGESVISRIEPLWHSNQTTTDLKPRDYLTEKGSFVSSIKQKLLMTNIDFALSNDGKYVALSLIKLPQDEEDPVAFELVHPPPNKAKKFYTYIVKVTQDRPVFRRYLMRLTGTIKFTEDCESFVICNIEHNNFISQTEGVNFIYVISTHHWRIQHKLVVDNFSDTLQVIPHPWFQIKTVKNSLLPGHFIFIEQWNTALLWSLSTGQLVSRFKCLPGDSFLDADAKPTLFALSHNQQMLATWTSKGVLTIYLCEGGLIFASSLQNTDKSLADSNKIELLWLEDDEHVITISSNGIDSTENCVHLWDIYTCSPISKFDNIEKNCMFEPNGRDFYITFEKDMPKFHKMQTPKSFQIPSKTNQKIIGRHHFLEFGFIKIYQYDSKKVLYESSPSIKTLSDDDPIVKLHIEPWLIYSPIKSGFCLDPDMKRVLYIGHYTIQIWNFKNDENPRLQFIWCCPMKDKTGRTPRTVYGTIEDATLRKGYDGRYTVEIRCQVNDQDQRSPSKLNIHQPPELSGNKPPPGGRLMTVAGADTENKFKFDLLLPDENEVGTFDIISNCIKSLGYISHVERVNWIQISSKSICGHFRTLLMQCQAILYDAIHNHSHVFNHIVESQSPLEMLIKVDNPYADRMIREHLKTDKHIPRFHDADRTKSALSRAINLGKTEVVRLLLDYYCRRCEENPISWTITVVPAMASLRTVYPDFALEFMKRISYLPVRDDIIRTDQEENYAYSKIEELDREAEENLYQRLMTWWSKSEKEIDKRIEHATELVRIPHKTHPARECVVPLPEFTVYKSVPESMKKSPESSVAPFIRRLINYLLYRKHRSAFIEEVLSGRYEIFGEPAMEAIINFKWRKFARVRVFFLLALYTVYLAAFLIGVSMKDDSKDLAIRKVSMIIVLCIGAYYFVVEVAQVIGQLADYWLHPYNLLDLGRCVLPMIVAEQYLRGQEPTEVLRGFAMIFIYANFILQFRIFRNIGVPIFMIFEILKKVWWVIVIIGVLVFGFAHIFHVLLRDDKDAPFTKYSTSLISVYLFLVGEYGAIDNLKERATIISILAFFIFIAVILLLNVLIALMSDVVNETKLTGKQAWLKQKAEVIAEIEMYLFTPAQRRRRDYFPSLIFYFANPDSIKSYMKKDENDDVWEGEEAKDDKEDELMLEANRPLQKPKGFEYASEVKRAATQKLKRGATLKLFNKEDDDDLFEPAE